MSYNTTKDYLLMRSGADTLEQEACVITQDQLMTIPDMYKRWTGKHKGLSKGQFVRCLCPQKKKKKNQII